MKLLFDHNLSPRLVTQLSDLFPDSDHVFSLEMDRMSDREIRTFAAAEKFAVVTKDADYGELHSLFGGPPKVIWIRRGNCSTDSVESMLRNHFEDICLFENDLDRGVLTLF
ncbi:MAG: DUF5615 family PIN-like protein [Pyrinomonadaceae bacterium]|nr:DUF5615 family PIN-like protein [Pyrinomonadaceae bacterium]